MEERLIQIIKEEVGDFFKDLESHFGDAEERLTNRIDYLKKSYSTIPNDRPEERKAREAERKDYEQELKDVKGMDDSLEKKKKDLEDKAKENADLQSKKTLNAPDVNNPVSTTTTTTITGGIS